MTLDQLTEEVLKRLQSRYPRTLLIGDAPVEHRFNCVSEPPYEQVVIGILSPSELLQMPSEPVCQALLQGVPVWIWPQPWRYGSRGLLLRRALMEAERRLILFGAKPVEGGMSQYDRWNCYGKSVGNQEVRESEGTDFSGGSFRK